MEEKSLSYLPLCYCFCDDVSFTLTLELDGWVYTTLYYSSTARVLTPMTLFARFCRRLEVSLSYVAPQNICGLGDCSESETPTEAVRCGAASDTQGDTLTLM